MVKCLGIGVLLFEYSVGSGFFFCGGKKVDGLGSEF